MLQPHSAALLCGVTGCNIGQSPTGETAWYVTMCRMDVGCVCETEWQESAVAQFIELSSEMNQLSKQLEMLNAGSILGCM